MNNVYTHNKRISKLKEWAIKKLGGYTLQQEKLIYVTDTPLTTIKAVQELDPLICSQYDYNELLDLVRKDLAYEIALKALEEGFIEFSEWSDPANIKQGYTAKMTVSKHHLKD